MAGPSDGASDRPQLSVVIPTFGGRHILPALVDRLRDALQGQSFEIILVHDGGPDGSWPTISELARADHRVRGINLRKNFGQHNAIMAGLAHTRGEAIVTMDDDLQHSPKDIGALLSKLSEGYDVCYATFKSRKHAAWKVVGSQINDYLATLLLGKPRGLYLSPFKCFSRAIRDELIKYDGPSVYVDGLIFAVTDNIASVEVEHHERPAGGGHYTLRKSIRLLLQMSTAGSIAPLRLSSFLGLTMAFLGLLLAVGFTIQRLTDPNLPIGWASLIVTSLILGGAQLLALGILGEYIGGLFLRVNARPQYVIADTVNIEDSSTPEAAKRNCVLTGAPPIDDWAWHEQRQDNCHSAIELHSVEGSAGLHRPLAILAGHELHYANYSGYPEYDQGTKVFDHHTSLLDTLFNCGPATREHLKSLRDRSAFLDPG